MVNWFLSETHARRGFLWDYGEKDEVAVEKSLAEKSQSVWWCSELRVTYPSKRQKTSFHLVFCFSLSFLFPGYFHGALWF